jgi:hypothetical protein
LIMTGNGGIYHFINKTTIYGPIYTNPAMTDFAFAPYAGRAYISPFASYPVGDLTQELGLPGENVYVYMGGTISSPASGTGKGTSTWPLGAPVHTAAGPPLVGNPVAASGIAGNSDAGLHVFGWVYETQSGYLSAPGAFVQFTTDGTHTVSFGNVPVLTMPVWTAGTSYVSGNVWDDDVVIEDEIFSPPLPFILAGEEEYYEEETFGSPIISIGSYSVVGDPWAINRQLVATKVITNYDGNPAHYTFYFVPGAIIPNNTDTFLNNVGFFDASLLQDASHLSNNFPLIPAGAVMGIYHNRMGVGANNANISVINLSEPGDPESINQISDFLLVPPDGNPITNFQELRDVMYVTKRARTVAFIDNQGDPTSWEMIQIDNSLGTGVHGIATVLDTGASNVDYLIVATFQGITLFNGRYVTPELGWKIYNRWINLNQNLWGKIQLLNAPIQKEIYVVMPDGSLMVGNYSVGMDTKSIKWEPWTFPFVVHTISIHNINEIIMGG